MSRPSEWRQFQLLSRDSLRKLLNSVVLGRDIDPAQLAIWMTAIVAVPPSMFAFGQMFKYGVMVRASDAAIERALLADRTFLVVYSMLATALLAALTWEALFPDRTDQEIIGALPVRPRTVAAGRLAAGLTMAGGFALAINLPAAAFFSLSAGTNPRIGFLPMVFFAHLVSAMAGCLLVFLALLMIRGIVAFCLGADNADRMATMLQLTTIVALIEVFFYFPTVLPWITRRMLMGGDATASLPPAWFVALYMWMGGSAREVMAAQASRGGLALLAGLTLIAPIYLLPARIMARRALELQARPSRSRIARGLRAAARLAPDGTTRAIAEFAITSLARNRRHMLIVVSYAGVGVAIAAIGVIAARVRMARGARDALFAPEMLNASLAVPLVMMFFIALGVRAAFRIPTDLDANWSFRVAPPSTRRAAAGTQLALFMLAIAPTTLIGAAIAASAGWSARQVLAFTAFDLAAGFLLIEALLLGWTIVPFTCSHEPSQQTMKSKWLIYLIPLNIFAFRGAALQAVALRSDAGTSLYLLLMLAIAIGIRVARLRRVRREPLTFDMPFDQRLEVLNLSEALQ